MVHLIAQVSAYSQICPLLDSDSIDGRGNGMRSAYLA
jgi:hypothetical protein